MFGSKHSTPPPPEPACITFGTYRAGGRPQPLRFSPEQFRAQYHRLIRGTSGSGKSKYLQSLCLQLLAAHEPFSLIDPHSDLGAGILSYLLDTGFFQDTRAFHRLLYLKFSRTDRYIPFNILNQPTFDPYTLASHIHEAIMRAFPTELASPLLSSILVPSLVVLIVNHLPVTALLPMLANKAWRDELLEYITDPLILSFFHDRFDQWGKGATIESTARRLQLLQFHPVLRYTLGQAENALDIRRLIDEGVSTIWDFGGLDADTVRLLACLVTVFYEKAALSREDTEERYRVPHHLIIDEAPTVTGSSGIAFAHMLEQTRKYKLYLTLACQTMSAFDKSLHNALSNVNCEVLFRQSEDDAKEAAHRFTSIHPTYIAKQRADSRLETAAQLREVTTLTLEQLQTGQAWVRSDNRVQPITTLQVPATRATHQDIQLLLDDYAQKLGTPASAAKREADSFMDRDLQTTKQSDNGKKPVITRWEEVTDGL